MDNKLSPYDLACLNEGGKRSHKRFDIGVLSRDEFIQPIIEFLKENRGLETEPSEFKQHLWFYKGRIGMRHGQSPVAIVGYGGSGKDIRDLPTPMQTEFLRFVFEFWEETSKGDSSIPLLILGHSFDEVFSRKLRLLKTAVKDLRMLQWLNVRNLENLSVSLRRIQNYFEDNLMKTLKIEDEYQDLQSAVIDYLRSGRELGGYSYDILDIEVPAGEGTKKTGFIDILARERKRSWLTVIELKWERITNRRLQSSIFQALDYCRWVEEHKRSLEMLFPKSKIDTRRRTRLILINGPEKFPPFYKEFIRSCRESDRYQEIELYYTSETLPITITPILPKNTSI